MELRSLLGQRPVVHNHRVAEPRWQFWTQTSPSRRKSNYPYTLTIYRDWPLHDAAPTEPDTNQKHSTIMTSQEIHFCKNNRPKTRNSRDHMQVLCSTLIFCDIHRASIMTTYIPRRRMCYCYRSQSVLGRRSRTQRTQLVSALQPWLNSRRQSKLKKNPCEPCTWERRDGRTLNVKWEWHDKRRTFFAR